MFTTQARINPTAARKSVGEHPFTPANQRRVGRPSAKTFIGFGEEQANKIPMV